MLPAMSGRGVGGAGGGGEGRRHHHQQEQQPRVREEALSPSAPPRRHPEPGWIDISLAKWGHTTWMYHKRTRLILSRRLGRGGGIGNWQPPINTMSRRHCVIQYAHQSLANDLSPIWRSSENLKTNLEVLIRWETFFKCGLNFFL